MSNKITLLETKGPALIWSGERDVNGLEDVTEVALSASWSPSVFDSVNRGKDRRNNEGFVRADYFLIDIDEGMTLEEAIKIARNFKCSIILSRNHGREKIRPSGGTSPACDRFRIIFQLASPIINGESYRATFFKLKRLFPNADDSCKDPARGYYKARDLYMSFDGDRLLPEKVQPVEVIRKNDVNTLIKGRLSKGTIKFIEEGAKSGERHQALVKATIDLKQNNYTLDEALKMLPANKDWWSDVDDRKVVGIYEGVEPKYPARIDGIVSSTEEFVYNWLTENQVAFSFSGLVTMGPDNAISSRSEVLRKIRLDRLRINMTKAYRDSDIEDIFDEWSTKAIQSHIEQFKINTIKPYDKERGEAEVKKLVVIMEGKENPLTEVVIKHFMWQVKRKAFGLEVHYPLMPVLVGKQGSGKSWLISKTILKPLGDMVTTVDFKTLTDSRESKLLTRNFALLVDEMSGADKKQVEEIKQILTKEVNSIRVMRETDHEVSPVKASFIGTSNKDIKDMIKDDTGMRRFFQINVVDSMDREAISKIDPSLLWSAVSKDRPAPYFEAEDEIRAHQEALTHKGPVEEWVLESGDVSFTTEGEFALSATELREAFVKWYGQSFSMTGFGRALNKVKGIQIKKTMKKNLYNLKLNNTETEF